MSELPQGWIECKLDNIAADVTYGYTAKSTNQKIGPHILRITDIQDNKVDWECVPYCKISNSDKAKYLLKDNDLVFARTGATVGKSFLISGEIPEAVYASYLIRVRCLLAETVGYLHQFFKSPLYWNQITELSAGIGQPNVNGSKLKELIVPLAPLPEQKRIADKLDTLLARVDATRERLDRIPQILKQFRQSVLAAATSGKLTEGWREENDSVGNGKDVVEEDRRLKTILLEKHVSLSKKKSSANSEVDEEYIFDIPATWVFSTWGKITEWITYGFTRPMPSTTKGIKLITAKDVRYFELRIDSAGYTTNSAFSQLSEKDSPVKGDLLITKDGTIGRAVLVNTDEKFCINQSVAVCWLRSTTMNKRFLEFVANTEYTQKFVLEKAKGMAIQHLSITDFAQCPVPVPPLVEQNEIVRRVEALFALADKLEARYQQARAQVNKLTPALLAKAFRGELVEQDPNDEPAEKLLERVRAAKAVAPVSKSKAKKMIVAEARPKKRGRKSKVA